MTRLRYILAVIALGVAGCGVPAPDGPADSFGLDFSLPEGAETRGAIVFVVDGVNASIFRHMLDAGELPAIKKYFVDRGLYCPQAVANVPSVTLVNLTSIVTGLFPGHHGITGNNWFDRNRLIWRNYNTIAQKNTLDGDYAARNIYEHFPRRTTASIFYQPHRGTTKFVENRLSAGPPFFFRWYEFIDRVTLMRFGLIMDIARKRREMPTVTTVYLLAPDCKAYQYGIPSDEYRRALRHTDRQIGRVLGDVERAGLLDEIVIALTADHGHANVGKHFHVDEFLHDDIGLKVPGKHLWEDTPFEERQKYYRNFNCVTNGSGDRNWTISLRKPVRNDAGRVVRFSPWNVRPNGKDLRSYPVERASQKTATRFEPIDLLKRFLDSAGGAVDIVAYRLAPNRVRILRRGGEVEFAQPAGRDGPISYRKISGGDPLSWLGKVPDALLNGKPATSREWLRATVGTDYPDLPAQILAYFRAKRAGDIALFAAPGWDFNRTNRAGHGGLRSVDMFVPLLLAGPGVPKGRISIARTVDVLPTLLQLLGKAVPPNLDGRSLVAAE